MPPDDNSNQGTGWPLPKFYFKVGIGDLGTVLFQEVSGLETETQQLEYRHGNNAQFSPVKIPGIAKFGNVNLKRGFFAKDNKFWEWYNQMRSNTVQRVPIAIQLLDEGGNPTMAWTLNNAWPTKITSADLDAKGHEVAVETLEIAHEGMTIRNT